MPLTRIWRPEIRNPSRSTYPFNRQVNQIHGHFLNISSTCSSLYEDRWQFVRQSMFGSYHNKYAFAFTGLYITCNTGQRSLLEDSWGSNIFSHVGLWHLWHDLWRCDLASLLTMMIIRKWLSHNNLARLSWMKSAAPPELSIPSLSHTMRPDNLAYFRIYIIIGM